MAHLADARPGRIRRAATLLALLVCAPPAVAGPWLAPGDAALRHDIQLLADAGILQAPVTTWPLSWPDVARAVLAAGVADSADPAVQAALARVQRAARRAQEPGFSGWRAGVSAADDPARLRSFGAGPREEGEVEIGGEWLGGRWAASLEARAVADPDDDRDLRLDGSYVAFTAANLIVTAGAIERWWGPGWEGSLILSTNARPIPSVIIERNYSDPFRLPVLRGLGPWRMSVGMGQAEGSGVDVPDVRLFTARVTFRPRSWLEIGLSRTAQWCGKGRPCDLGTFTDLLTGRDNRSESLPESDEPGNQMAGYDLRLRSPWPAVPAALYAQYIGEDEAGGLPSKFLGLAGVEAWGGSRLGSYRLHVEYADTACSFSRKAPEFDCAYRNALYPQGYTYRGRSLGHALGADGRMLSLGLQLVRPSGASWDLLARRADLNRGGAADPAHPVSPVGAELKGLELRHTRSFAWGRLSLGLGVEDVRGPLEDGSGIHGFLHWRQDH